MSHFVKSRRKPTIDRLWAMTVFVRVAECRNFTAAARSLNVANATITSCIGNLERHLDTTLIYRDTRRVSLSEEGLIYLERAREVLQAVKDAESELHPVPAGPQGHLHIETPVSIGHALICPSLAKFAARYPAVTTSITMTNQPHHMIERAIDVAIRTDAAEGEHLVARPLYESRYVVCCAPWVAATLPAHPAQLEPRLCVGLQSEDRRAPNTWRLQRGREALTLTPSGPLRFNNSDALVSATMDGAGVACVLDIFASRHIANGALVGVYRDWDTPAKTFHAVTSRTGAASPKVRAFIDFLTETLDAARRPPAGRPVLVKALRRG